MPVEAEAKWLRADTDNFIIYSEGNERSLRDFAQRLQRFDATLRWRFNVKAPPLPTRLTIYLLPQASDVGKLRTGKAGSMIAGFYHAAPDGSFALSHRDATVLKGTSNAQQTLFHEYAHHFMRRYTADAFPGWFIEGFAEFFSTVDFNKEGQAEIGKPAYRRAFGLLTMPKIPVSKLLTGTPGSMRTVTEADVFYGRAWLLTHMLYSDPARAGQLGRYIEAINRGEMPEKAATSAFGALEQLDKDLNRYMQKPLTYRTTDAPMPEGARMEIRALSAAEDALLPAHLERINAGGNDERVRAVRDRLRLLSKQHGASAPVWFELASAEWALDDDVRDLDAARMAVERALELEPAHVRANVLLARILTATALKTSDDDKAMWSAVRKSIVLANRTDPDDPVPLFAYYRSFIDEGKSPPAIALTGLETAYALAPENVTLRMGLASAYAGRGQYDAAIKLAKIVAYDPHDDGEGARIMAELEKARDRAKAGEGEDALPGQADASD